MGRFCPGAASPRGEGRALPPRPRDRVLHSEQRTPSVHGVHAVQPAQSVPD